MPMARLFFFTFQNLMGQDKIGWPACTLHFEKVSEGMFRLSQLI